jgi:hypothetical protein
MSAYQTILSRIPVNLPSGKSRIIGNTVEIGMKLAEQVAVIDKRDDLTAKGRAGLMRAYLKSTAINGRSIRGARPSRKWPLVKCHQTMPSFALCFAE